MLDSYFMEQVAIRLGNPKSNMSLDIRKHRDTIGPQPKQSSKAPWLTHSPLSFSQRGKVVTLKVRPNLHQPTICEWLVDWTVDN